MSAKALENCHFALTSRIGFTFEQKKQIV